MEGRALQVRGAVTMLKDSESRETVAFGAACAGDAKQAISAVRLRGHRSNTG
jgi:hypothetical protein